MTDTERGEMMRAEESPDAASPGGSAQHDGEPSASPPSSPANIAGSTGAAKEDETPVERAVENRWCSKRLFVSSTFDDMAAERDIIAKHVLPQLRSLGEERAIHVVGVDLRWGIPIETDAERHLVARQCLEAVDACRPYLLALLGPRRGWVLSATDFEPAFIAEHPALRRALKFGLSLTELEIVHAVAPLVGSGEPSSALLLVQGGIGELAEPLRAALRDFGVDIARSPAAGVRVFAYDKLVGDGGITELRVGTTPLATALRTELADLLGLNGEPIAATGVDDYDDRVRVLAMNGTCAPDDLARVSEIVGIPGRLVLVEGPTGSGKTTLLAHLADRLIRDGSRATLHRFLGSAIPPDDEEALLVSLCTELEQARGLADTTKDRRRLSRRWSAAWHSRGAVAPPVLILDALDAAPVDPTALHWLAVPVIHGGVLVVSVNAESREGQALRDALRGWPQTVPVELGGLPTPSQREQVIRESLTVHLKTLDRSAMQALVDHPAARDPLFLAVALAELRLHGRHDDLVDQINRRFATSRDGAIEALLDRLESETARSADEIRLVLGALAHSPSGLSTEQLARLAATYLDAPDDPAEIEATLRQLDAFLQRRPFAHAIATGAFREVLLRRYAEAPLGEDSWDAALARLLRPPVGDESTSAGAAELVRRLHDLPYHLRRAGRAKALAEHLLDVDQVLQRVQVFGERGLRRELELATTVIDARTVVDRVSEMAALLQACADQLYWLGTDGRASSIAVAQCLTLQAGLMGFEGLEEEFAQRLTQASRRARVRWVEGAGSRRGVISADPEWCTQLALSSDGRWLVFVGERTAAMFDTASLQEACQLGTFDADTGAFSVGPRARAAFNADGTRLALAFGDNDLHVVDVCSGVVLQRWKPWSTTPTSLCWVDGLVVAAAGDELISVEPQSGKSDCRRCAGARALTWMPPTGEVLVGTATGELIRASIPFDARDDDVRTDFTHGEITTVVADPTGTTAWALPKEGTVVHWEIGSAGCYYLFGRASQLSDIALSVDGRRLLAAHADGAIHVYDVASDRITPPVKAVQNAALAVAASPTGLAWVAGTPDLDRTEIVSVAMDGQDALDDWVNAVALSPDDAIAVDARYQGRVWGRDARTKGYMFDLEPHGTMRCFCCRFNGDGSVLFAGFLDRLVLADPLGHEVIAQLGQDQFDGVRAVGVAPDDAFFVAGDSQNSLVAFNGRHERFAAGELDSPPSAIEVLADHHVLVLEEKGRITLRDPFLRIVTEWPNAGDRSWAMSIASNDEWFVTGHRHRIARWSTKQAGEPLVVVDAGIGEVECLNITSSDQVLAAGGRTGLLRFWASESGEVLLDLPFPSAVENLAISAEGSLVLLSLAQATLVCLDVSGLP